MIKKKANIFYILNLFLQGGKEREFSSFFKLWPLLTKRKVYLFITNLNWAIPNT